MCVSFVICLVQVGELNNIKFIFDYILLKNVHMAHMTSILLYTLLKYKIIVEYILFVMQYAVITESISVWKGIYYKLKALHNIIHFKQIY